MAGKTKWQRRLSNTRRRAKGERQAEIEAAWKKAGDLEGFAINKHVEVQHLVRVLIGAIAVCGDQGSLTLAGEKLAQIPATARLQQYYNKETGDLTLLCVVGDDDEPVPEGAVEVVQPIIEIVSR